MFSLMFRKAIAIYIIFILVSFVYVTGYVHGNNAMRQPRGDIKMKHQDIVKASKSGHLDEGIFNALLKDIKSTTKNLKDIVQEAAMQSMLWAFVHQDFDKASKLALTVRDELSKNQFSQLKTWFETYGPFGWRRTEDKNYEAFGGFKFRKSNSPEASKFDLDNAFKNPWFTLKNEGAESEQEEVKPIFASAFLRRIDKLINDMEKAVTQHLLDNPTVSEKQVTDLKESLKEVKSKFDYLSGETKEPNKAPEGSIHHERNRLSHKRRGPATSNLRA